MAEKVAGRVPVHQVWAAEMPVAHRVAECKATRRLITTTDISPTKMWRHHHARLVPRVTPVARQPQAHQQTAIVRQAARVRHLRPLIPKTISMTVIRSRINKINWDECDSLSPLSRSSLLIHYGV
jgi:hypothetical protein